MTKLAAYCAKTGKTVEDLLFGNNTSEQDGADQPATSSESKPKGNEKPPEFIREIVAIKIPRITTMDTTLNELIDFIALRIMELDPHKPGGISILTSGFKDANHGNDQPVDPGGGAKKVNYSAKDVRVDKVFTDLARLFQVEFHVTSVGVVVTPTDVRPFPNAKADKGDIYCTYKGKPGEDAGRDDGDKPEN